jgi:hypothetical protein
MLLITEFCFLFEKWPESKWWHYLLSGHWSSFWLPSF